MDIDRLQSRPDSHGPDSAGLDSVGQDSAGPDSPGSDLRGRAHCPASSEATARSVVLSGVGARLLLLLVMASPCLVLDDSLADEPPAAGDAIAAEVVGHIENIAARIADGDGDCDATAQTLLDYASEHRSALYTASMQLDRLPEDQQVALQKKYRARLEAAMTSMASGVKACRGHEAFDKAMDKLSTAPEEPEDLCRQWRRVLQDTEGESCDVLANGLKLLEPASSALVCTDALEETTLQRCSKSTPVKNALKRLNPATPTEKN